MVMGYAGKPIRILAGATDLRVAHSSANVR